MSLKWRIGPILSPELASSKGTFHMKGMCAPSAIRTRDLPLRSNPGPDAVAISDGAGHASRGRRCCSPIYLVITSRDNGPTTGTTGTAWIVSQPVASRRLTGPWTIRHGGELLAR